MVTKDIERQMFEGMVKAKIGFVKKITASGTYTIKPVGITKSRPSINLFSKITGGSQPGYSTPKSYSYARRKYTNSGGSSAVRILNTYGDFIPEEGKTYVLSIKSDNFRIESLQLFTYNGSYEYRTPSNVSGIESTTFTGDGTNSCGISLLYATHYANGDITNVWMQLSEGTEAPTFFEPQGNIVELKWLHADGTSEILAISDAVDIEVELQKGDILMPLDMTKTLCQGITLTAA